MAKFVRSVARVDRFPAKVVKYPAIVVLFVAAFELLVLIVLRYPARVERSVPRVVR